ILEATYTEYLDYIESVPYVSRKGIEIILRELAEKEPKAQQAKPKGFLAHRILDELEREALCNTLWGRQPVFLKRSVQPRISRTRTRPYNHTLLRCKTRPSIYDSNATAFVDASLGESRKLRVLSSSSFKNKSERRPRASYA